MRIKNIHGPIQVEKTFIENPEAEKKSVVAFKQIGINAAMCLAVVEKETEDKVPKEKSSIGRYLEEAQYQKTVQKDYLFWWTLESLLQQSN